MKNRFKILVLHVLTVAVLYSCSSDDDSEFMVVDSGCTLAEPVGVQLQMDAFLPGENIVFGIEGGLGCRYGLLLAFNDSIVAEKEVSFNTIFQVPNHIEPGQTYRMTITNDTTNTVYIDTTFTAPNFTSITRILDKDVGPFYGTFVVVNNRSFLDSAVSLQIGFDRIELPLTSDTIHVDKLSVGEYPLSLFARFSDSEYFIEYDSIHVGYSYIPFPMRSDGVWPDTLVATFYSQFAPEDLRFTLNNSLAEDPIPLQPFATVLGRTPDGLSFYQSRYLIDYIFPDTYLPIVTDPNGDTLVTEKYHTVTVF